MISIVATVVVVVCGLVLVGFAVFALVYPVLVEQLIRSYAASPLARVGGQTWCLATGVSIFVLSFSAWLPVALNVVGMIFIAIAIASTVIPWRWHHRFGVWWFPRMVRHMPLCATVAAAIGALLLYGVYAGFHQSPHERLHRNAVQTEAGLKPTIPIGGTLIARLEANCDVETGVSSC